MPLELNEKHIPWLQIDILRDIVIRILIGVEQRLDDRKTCRGGRPDGMHNAFQAAIKSLL